MKIKTIILIILLAVTHFSCRSVKKVSATKTEVKQTQKTEIKKDSFNIVDRNQEIKNEYTIPLKTADSLTNARIKQALANFKAGAKSGSNSTRIFFDEDALALKIAAIVGATQTQTITTNNEENTSSTLEERADQYISKKVRSIPWWFYALVIFWFFPQILQRVKSVINPISAILKK